MPSEGRPAIGWRTGALNRLSLLLPASPRPSKCALRLTLRCTRRPTAGCARFRPRVNSNYKGFPVCQARVLLGESRQRFILVFLTYPPRSAIASLIEQGAD